MTKRLFNDRKAVKVYMGSITYIRLEKLVGKGKVNEFIRRAIEDAMEREEMAAG